MSAQLLDLPVDEIGPHPRNVRRDVGDVTELAASIEAEGLLSPLLVAPNPNAGQDRIDGDTEPAYVVLAGHRRLAAVRLAALPTAECRVLDEMPSDAQVTLTMLVENLQRSDLSPIEEATAYHQLELAGMTSKDIAKQTGRARSTVDSRMRLLDLPDTVKDRVHAHQISLDEAAVLGEFADDRRVTKNLEAALGTSNWQFEVRRSREAAKTAAELAAQRQAIAERGIDVVDLQFPIWQIGDQHPEVQKLDDLGYTPVWLAPDPDDAGVDPRALDIAWPEHEACPGHAITIVSLYQRAWICTDAGLHHGAGSSAGDDGEDGAAAARRAAADAHAAEDAALRVAHAEALAAARTVRLEFLRPLVNGAPGKPLSKYQAAAVAAHLVAMLPIAEYVINGQGVLDVLGDDYSDIDVDTLDDRAIELLGALDPHRALLTMIAESEEDGTEREWCWGPRYLPDRRRWMGLLESIGYQASDFELSLIADPDVLVVEDVVTDLADYDDHAGGQA